MMASEPICRVTCLGSYQQSLLLSYPPHGPYLPLYVISGLRTAIRLFGGGWWLEGRRAGDGGLALKTSYSFCHEGTSDVATS